MKKSKRFKCLIPGCSNHSDEGSFVGDLCMPCHSYIVANDGVHSQAYRNEIAKAELRRISIQQMLNVRTGKCYSAFIPRKFELLPRKQQKLPLLRRVVILYLPERSSHCVGRYHR